MRRQIGWAERGAGKALGFTLVEILVVMALMGILAGLVVVSLIRPQTTASSSASEGQLVGDLRGQQMRAMMGDSSTGASADTYGVHIETNSYTLFKGATYSNGAAGNFVVDLDDTIVLSTSLPSAQVVFTKSEGAVSGFAAGSNTITISNSAGADTRIVTINRYGVVTLN